MEEYKENMQIKANAYISSIAADGDNLFSPNYKEIKNNLQNNQMKGKRSGLSLDCQIFNNNDKSDKNGYFNANDQAQYIVDRYIETGTATR